MPSVILVDQHDVPLGEMEKMEAHRQGLLHRAFSVFIFNYKGEMLLHKRADEKYHSAGLWTNACCSHPAPGEDIQESAVKRLYEEMGIRTEIIPAFSFKYKAEFENGLTEHEFDHVFVGKYNGDIIPDKNEVSEFAYVPMDVIRKSLEYNGHNFTAWFKIAFPKVEEYLAFHPL